MIGAVVLLTSCQSSNPRNRPRVSTSTSTARSTTSIAPTTSAPPTTSTVSALGRPRIISLTGPRLPVECNAPTSVALHWETRGAATVTLRIDAEPVFATYADGGNDKLVPLACDGKAHRYTLTARAADGKTSARTLTITERRL
jgi:hypothetical protein